MYDTIIVATDFSDENSSTQSLQKAEKLSDNGRIILLHVIPNVPSYAVSEVPHEIMKEVVPNRRDALRKIVKKSKVKAGTETRNGNAYRQIIGSAEEHEADLIIVNSHKPALSDYLLGSTAAKVVRHAKCSVLIER